MEHGRTVMQNREDDNMVELDTSLASVCPDSLLGGTCELPHCKSSFWSFEVPFFSADDSGVTANLGILGAINLLNRHDTLLCLHDCNLWMREKLSTCPSREDVADGRKGGLR